METPKQLSNDHLDGQVKTVKRDFIFVRHNNIISKVKLNEVKWINAEGNYCFIHTACKKFAVKISLKKLSDRLSSVRFLRIHKSYVVQINYIERIDTNQNFLVINGEQLPVGRVFKSALLKRLEIL